MEALGEFLKKGREKAGVTLDELAQRTRIRIENLESLEKEDLDNLPSDAYVRGFVRQVCRELGVSPNEGLVRYEMLRARSGPPDEMTWAEERVDETPGRLERALEDPARVVRIARRSYRWAGIALGAGVVVLMLVLGWRVIRGVASSRTAGPQVVGAVQESAPQNLADAPASAPQRKSEPKNASRSDPKGESVNESKVVPKSEAKREPEPAQAPVEKPAPKRVPPPSPPVQASVGSMAMPLPTESVPAPRREPIERTEPKSEPAATIRRETVAPIAEPPASGERVVLEVEALRPVRVTVLLDGAGQPRRASLAAGERRQWKAVKFFDLTANDGGALLITIDGRPLGPVGEDDRGAVRTLTRTSR